MPKISSWIPKLWSNWISLLGVVLTTVAGGTLLVAFVIELMAEGTNVYATTFLFLLLPMLFVFGLLLIPVGIWRQGRKTKRAVEEQSLRVAFGELLQRPIVRRRLFFVVVLTVVNIALVAGAGYKAVSFMESPEFCGTLCHEVMQPEYEAYLRSPHARVHCVDCHIGPGASWAVRSKIDGLRQVWAVMTDDFSRPIPSPVHDLRPARDTCEQCHWPAKFHGNRIIYRTHFRSDEENTPEVNALLLKVGGENPRTGRHEGIHWHVSSDTRVVYEALDEKREKIGKVTVVRGDEIVAEYLPAEKGGAPLEVRTMDCVDCHNRPTHVYDGSPGEALDWALESGVLDPSVPYLRKLAEPILARADRPREGVETALLAELGAAYDKEHPDLKPDAEALQNAAAGMALLYQRNIFPEMNVGWDTYPTHQGHRGDENDIRGCFRCHDDEHETADGTSLSQDCQLCHEILAEEEEPDDLPDSLRTGYLGEE